MKPLIKNFQLKHLAVFTFAAMVSASTSPSCNLTGSSDGSAVTITESSASPTPTATASPSPSPSPSPTPSYGMNCTGTFGYDSFANYPVFYLSSINGSSINSIKMNLYGNGLGMSNVVGSITLTAYTCGTASTLGSNVATATWNHTSLNGNAAQQTFTFSSPVTIPTNCAPGEKPLAFKVTYSGFGGAAVWAEEVLSSASCFLTRSTSTTGLASSPHSYTAIIDANP